MKVYEGVDVSVPQFLTSVVDGGECSDSRPGRFIPRKNPLLIRYGRSGIENS
jgi:hypothetical protein